ncbi:hypothetical protein POM88_020449 [Heracleum sosnowskyi]|uniref:AMMECR1 domain-containing protein n=1 Tax=Heracleum sosnowskyi TaxID=360622 RepID=A0AAD8MRY9_9APIA|nr:hypothetical protein POM88_020449 [Heracleum sosnowskyi]
MAKKNTKIDVREIHLKLLDDLVRVNSLLTIAVFVGLSMATPGIRVRSWTTLEAIDSLIRKAGYNGAITESLRKQIRLTRYQSTLFTMHYSEYTNYVKTTRGATPSLAGAKASN